MAAIDPTAPAMHSGSAMASEAIGKAMWRNGNQAHSASTSTVQAVAPSTSPDSTADNMRRWAWSSETNCTVS